MEKSSKNNKIKNCSHKNYNNMVECVVDDLVEQYNFYNTKATEDMFLNKYKTYYQVQSDNTYWQSIMDGVERELSKRGYYVIPMFETSSPNDIYWFYFFKNKPSKFRVFLLEFFGI